MRREITAQGSTLTASELREALEGVDDGAPVFLGSLPVIGAVGEDLRLVLEPDAEGCWCD